MRAFLVGILLLATPLHAQEVAQYVCTIGGVYENVGGKLVQRPSDKALGQLVYINADTGEVTGSFGTDGDHIEKIRRPPGKELLTIETAVGILGNAANRLYVGIPDKNSGQQPFVYTKNWLIVSGECNAVMRH